jgi:dihydrofolate reductase
MKKTTHINIIVALGKQNQIGLNGSMPWHLSDDLKNFKKITSGHTIIMGRKTFDSIGRALPNRMNFVVTSKHENVNAFEVCSFKNLEKAIDKAKIFEKEIYIIGGASIYEQMLDKADKMIITHVDYDGEADTFFPEIDYQKWKIYHKKSYKKDNHNDYNFEIVTYTKKH